MSKQRRIIAEKGITLIALVITILLLIILAAVVIRGLTGDNRTSRNNANGKRTIYNSII